ncbi:hypothetical protein VQH23_16380 [Pararoseomonas sp. SCSIO 73927]|uniref:hypothetical protein n=1 Tax=Pararoseomonas sp. SCSIO 73927 TaxID=3114537 RepID=UPI0030CAD6BE
MDRQPHFTDIFAHEGHAFRAVAYEAGDRWELAIIDEDGLIRCFWRPDPDMLQERPAEMVPSVLKMIIIMVKQGVLPLQAAQRAD